MSEKTSAMMMRMQHQEAMAGVMKTFVPQLFSHPKHLSGDAEDSGGQDEWMLTNMPAEVLVALTALDLIGVQDKRNDVRDFVNLVLRGLKGVNGFTVKQGENIATALGGGMGRKTVKRPGVVGRNVTNRDWRERAEAEGAEIEE